MVLEKLLKRWQEISKPGVHRERAEKRKYIRMAYPPNRRPVLQVKDHQLEVLNISEKGLKIFNHKQAKLSKNISGNVVFSSGKSIELLGKIAWEHQNELGLFVTQVPRSVIMDEVRALLRDMSDQADA
jgi:hypothetical protein